MLHVEGRVGETHGIDDAVAHDATSARRRHRLGLRRLFHLQLGREARDLWRNLPDPDRLALQFVTLGNTETLRDDLLEACIDRLCVSDEVRDAETFHTRLDAVMLPLAELDPEDPTALDLRTQLDDLVYPGFVTATPAAQLGELPRYLEAARRRLANRALDAARERARAAELAPWVARWHGMRERCVDDPELENYRWLLEEFRVSLYAQELGTAQPASASRLAKQWSKVSDAGAPG